MHSGRLWSPARELSPPARLPTLPGLTPPAPRLSVVLVTLLFVLALSGRFPVYETVLGDYSIRDLRVPGCIALGFGTLLWYADQRLRGWRQPWPRAVLLLYALIGVQMLAAFWAPPGAWVERAMWDLTALLVLVVATTVLAAGDPERAARLLLVLILGAAVVYALGALAAGPQGQGRYSAFGGGPNIFVRVVSLGIIATAALTVVSRRWLLLVPLPLLAAAAVLSGSRGGLVSLVIAAMAFFLLFARRRFIILAGTLVIGSMVAWAVWVLAGNHLTTVAERRYSVTDLERSNFSARPGLLSEAWAIFTAQPLAGGGLDGFRVRTGVAYPHNFLAGLAAECGVVALVLAVLVALWWWRDGRPWPARSTEQIGCAVGAIFIASASMFSGDFYDTRFCWILGIVAILPPVSTPGKHREKQETPSWQITGRRGAGLSY